MPPHRRPSPLRSAPTRSPVSLSIPDAPSCCRPHGPGPAPARGLTAADEIDPQRPRRIAEVHYRVIADKLGGQPGVLDAAHAAELEVVIGGMENIAVAQVVKFGVFAAARQINRSRVEIERKPHG